MENNANNETQAFHGIRLSAIEEIIIENRQLKIRIKEILALARKCSLGMNSELARYKNLKEEDNGVISELNRQLELCRMPKNEQISLTAENTEGKKQ